MSTSMTPFDDTAVTSSTASGLARGHGVSVWRQIADALEDEIASGRLRSGAQLPTEAALAERFGVNRHTVRRALAALARQGIVRATQGRGTFVEPKPLTYPIGPRTRFSEIVARAGQEAWGDLMSEREIRAHPSLARRLEIPDEAPRPRAGHDPSCRRHTDLQRDDAAAPAALRGVRGRLPRARLDHARLRGFRGHRLHPAGDPDHGPDRDGRGGGGAGPRGGTRRARGGQPQRRRVRATDPGDALVLRGGPRRVPDPELRRLRPGSGDDGRPDARRGSGRRA